MKTPVKPFPSYKWRWLSVAPSEGLLRAPVFLGVLRALQRHEGEPYSSIGLYKDLKRVQKDTDTTIDLARTPERNLFRNSGQYWRGTGLVAPVSGEIVLTDLGQRVASGYLTNDEFAALMVRNTVLPNPATYSAPEMEKWRDANLRIKPLELILATMNKLGQSFGITQAYLTANELIEVVIPLAGAKTPVHQIVDSVAHFRKGRLDVSDWPDCVPGANDKRLAREFLLFLRNFGICQADETAERYEQKFYIDQVLTDEIVVDVQQSFLEDFSRYNEELEISRDSEIPLLIERTRVVTSAIRRPNQTRFRKDVFHAGSGRCILTNERTSEVLEAAHIIPVGQGGTDHVSNGFCMRVDIHRLYDSGKIRIAPDGAVSLHDQIEKSVSYANLPKEIVFPVAIGVKNIEWRSRYL